jgi:hypothetical protein
MSYFNKQQSAQQGKKPLPNNNKQFQQRPVKKAPEEVAQKQQEQEQERDMLKFTQDEIVFIENVLVKLEDMIPNDQGENQEILEMIVTCQQIIGARLDQESGFIGDSA